MATCETSASVVLVVVDHAAVRLALPTGVVGHRDGPERSSVALDGRVRMHSAAAQRLCRSCRCCACEARSRGTDKLILSDCRASCPPSPFLPLWQESDAYTKLF